MAAWTNNLCPARLEYGGVSLGETQGGVNVTVEFETAESLADITGNTARIKAVQGVTAQVTAPLTEASLEQLLAVYPGSSQPEDNRVHFGNPVGQDLVELADELIIKPIIAQTVSTDETKFIYVPKASVVPNWDIVWSPSEQKIYSVTFEAHPVLADDIASGGDLNGEGYLENDLLCFSAETT